MQYRNLGSSGLKVSRICLGALAFGSPQWRPWILDESASRPLIKQAIELGINFFDTANIYSLGESENILGKALKDFSSNREDVVIATKVHGAMGDGPNQHGLSRKHIMHQIDQSLRRLKTDYVDLYQIHRYDPTTPVEETLEALTDVVKAGKARYIGASSMYAWQFANFLKTSEKGGFSRIVSMQNHYNLIYREEEREMIPLCELEGIGILPWSPLARGFLAGNRQSASDGKTERAQTDDWAHKNYYKDSDFAVMDRVNAVASECGVSNAQVAFAWVLQQPFVTAPIIGVTKLPQLEEAVQAVKVKLTGDQIQRLNELYQPHPIIGHS